MTTQFSLTDTIWIAFSSCVPCFTNSSLQTTSSTDTFNPHAHGITRARPDELQGLLLSAGEGSDTDAERMSLHSNPGGTRSSNKKNKRRSKKRITLFGYDLFGGPSEPPIHLPESDDEDDEGQRRGGRGRGARTLSSSTSTFDSDAAVLDSSMIATISAGDPSATNALAREEEEAEEEERRQRKERRKLEKEQRRQKRRARKELESLADVSGEFEGFQGSAGPLLHPKPKPPPGKTVVSNDNEDDAEADLDGGLYIRKSASGNDDGNRSRSGSDSKSKTTTTTTTSRYSDHQPATNPTLHPNPNPFKLSSKSSMTHGSSTSASRSRSSGSSSTSGSSPISPTFPAASQEPPRSRSHSNSGQMGSKSGPKARSKLGQDTHSHHVDHTRSSSALFDGTQGLSEADIPFTPPSRPQPLSSALNPGSSDTYKESRPIIDSGFPSRGLSRSTSTSTSTSGGVSQFPSTGFGSGGGAPRMQRANSILAKGGAFLATRGDDAGDI